LNSKDTEEALEQQKPHHRMDWIPVEWSWNKATTKALGLQGRCVVYLFKSLCTYTPHEIASHN